MFNFTMSVKCDSTTENVQEEMIRILERVTGRIAAGKDEGSVSDINGNKLGKWDLS